MIGQLLFFNLIMKKRILVLLSLLFAGGLCAQQTGVNTDPFCQRAGHPPYEMEGRSEPQPSFTGFSDCTLWEVKAKHAVAALYRSKEQYVYESYSGRVVYTTQAREAEIDLLLRQPLSIDSVWDCIDVWTYGDHWLWGEPEYVTAMQLYVLFKDSKGRLHEMNMVQAGYSQLAHKYWFLNHLKLEHPVESGSQFVGFKLKGSQTDAGVQHSVFLGPVYVYREKSEPLKFKDFPEHLPFPVRKETLLPLNKCTDFHTEVKQQGEKYFFCYKGADCNLSYAVTPGAFLEGLSVIYKEKEQPIMSGAAVVFEGASLLKTVVLEKKLRRDTLFITCEAGNGKERCRYICWYTLCQKTLICGIEEKDGGGHIKEIRNGNIPAGPEALTVRVPFLNYNYSDGPAILYSGGLFYFPMYDWYYSNASGFFSDSGIKENVFVGGGVRYVSKTDGERNAARERLFIMVSPDVHEVFPTIDNPPSPMRSLQAERLWAINGGAGLDILGNFVRELRSKGVEKVTIRYHEDLWRSGGESYTFRTEPNPEIGEQRLREYIQFVKDQGWRVGLYSNYTDLSPVNANWNPDWVKRGPKGEWEVSWSRCYAPKPQIAWEQEAVFAPQIHRLFRTNHSYCDVHTAVSPMSRVDYDHRVPGAGMMRTVIERYGMLLMNERQVYSGPVYSEGGNHWWYAGLTDGNYANGNLQQMPVFPDFQLLKIHPLEMDAANTGDGYEYVCYALAYGHIGILSTGDEAVKRYAFLQPLQNSYVMVPVGKILYFEKDKSYEASEAIKKGLLKRPRLYVEYASGLKVYVNFSEETWPIRVGDRDYILPPSGFYAYLKEQNLRSFSVSDTVEGGRRDQVDSDDLHFVSTSRHNIQWGMGGVGPYLIKREKFSWEIIPLEGCRRVCFDLKVIGLENFRVKIEGLDRQGDLIKEFVSSSVKQIDFLPDTSVYKYRLIPVK